MRIHLINPSDTSFGIGVITPRWLYVLAAATPSGYGEPLITDETLDQIQSDRIQPGDIVGIGIHTGNALRGMEVGRIARERGAWVVYGGIHATLYPEEAFELGGAHVVVKGDGDVVWAKAIADLVRGAAQRIYDGGRISRDQFLPARWDLAPRDRYMWASVQTVRGCPKHCSFCSVWRTDGQTPRARASDVVIEEIVHLRRLGFRFIALADDNFYPVTLTDIQLAKKQHNAHCIAELQQMRAERFELMEKLRKLPADAFGNDAQTIKATSRNCGNPGLLATSPSPSLASRSRPVTSRIIVGGFSWYGKLVVTQASPESIGPTCYRSSTLSTFWSSHISLERGCSVA